VRICRAIVLPITSEKPTHAIPQVIFRLTKQQWTLLLTDIADKGLDLFCGGL
jgi:hypothetical protein